MKGTKGDWSIVVGALLAVAVGACSFPSARSPDDPEDAGGMRRPDAAVDPDPDAGHTVDPDPDAGRSVADAMVVDAMVARIEREVLPAYEIEYRNSRFVPPPGQTLLILGQTVDGIEEHVETFSDEPLPAGWATYWGVPSVDGINDTHTTEEGATHNHRWLVDTFDDAVVQSAMWMVGTWEVDERTANGDFDDVIRTYADWAKAAERPIYLRIGYEFDGPHNEMEPVEYIAAYRHVVDLLRAEGVENIAYVWHSYASTTYEGHPVSAWYPGDDYVDWVGISLFGHMYGTGPYPDLEAVMAFALEQRKPVMIAEATPTRGISADNDRAWEWFANLLSFSYARNIKAISIIVDDWTRMTFALRWGDARLQNNANIAAAFFRETNRERYLKAGPTLYEALGYRSP